MMGKCARFLVQVVMLIFLVVNSAYAMFVSEVVKFNKHPVCILVYDTEDGKYAFIGCYSQKFIDDFQGEYLPMPGLPRLKGVSVNKQGDIYVDSAIMQKMHEGYDQIIMLSDIDDADISNKKAIFKKLRELLSEDITPKYVLVGKGDQQVLYRYYVDSESTQHLDGCFDEGSDYQQRLHKTGVALEGNKLQKSEQIRTSVTSLPGYKGYSEYAQPPLDHQRYVVP